MGVQIVDDVGNFFLNQEGTEAGGPIITNSIQPGSGYAGSVNLKGKRKKTNRSGSSFGGGRAVNSAICR